MFFRFYENRVAAFWCFLFVLSKVVELGDTLFIVLRKKKLIFLHWYHHITVLYISWTGFPYCISVARWFGTINVIVHSLMYSYFAISSLNIKVPKVLAMCLTLTQLAQMFIGAFVNIWAFNILQSGGECHVSYGTLRLFFFIYLSYAVLFLNFFINAYITDGKPKKNKFSFNIEYSRDKVE